MALAFVVSPSCNNASIFTLCHSSGALGYRYNYDVHPRLHYLLSSLVVLTRSASTSHQQLLTVASAVAPLVLLILAGQ